MKTYHIVYLHNPFTIKLYRYTGDGVEITGLRLLLKWIRCLRAMGYVEVK